MNKNATEKQLALIKKMEQYCPLFKGSTCAEASEYISNYLEDFREAERNDNPTDNYWAIVNGYD